MGVVEILAIVAAVYTLSSLRIIRQYERAVSFFLGRYWNTKGPGLIFLPSMIAHMHRVSLRIVALDIPPQEVITRDNVSLKVNAVLYMKVADPAAAIIQIENYLYATSQLAQTTLRAVLGQHVLDELSPSARGSTTSASRCASPSSTGRLMGDHDRDATAASVRQAVANTAYFLPSWR